MKAIIKTGGKQYYVSEGDEIYVEKLPNEAGSTIVIEDVLMVDGNINPKNAKVECLVEKHGKNKKVIVFKYRPKKKYRNKKGHRQPYTKLIIKKITG